MHSEPMSSAKAFNLSAERATSASLTPSAANRLATAAPMPELAPVTIMVLLFRLPFILGLPAVGRRLTRQTNQRVESKRSCRRIPAHD
jgi:hypothetical protein